MARKARWIGAGAVKSLAVLAFVLFAMAPWGELRPTQAQSVGASGCVRYCNGGSSSSSGRSGGAGCAQMASGGVGPERVKTSTFMNNRGVESYTRGNYLVAVSSFETAVGQNPNNQTARRNLGDALAMLGQGADNRGDYGSALSYYERATKYNRSPTYRAKVKGLRGKLGSRGKTCALCGKALMNDVAYGLDNSASVLTYVNQSRANYSNCTRDIQSGCSNTPGKQLFDNLLNCNKRLYRHIPSFKSCARTSVRGARLSN